MPPSVHCADVLTSTGNHTPCGRSQALSASSTTPGLDRHGLRLAVEREHPIEVLAVIDHQRRADRLPALRAARAARQHRNAELAADVERGAHVVVALRHQHADRHRPGRSTRRSSSGRATRGRTAPRPRTAPRRRLPSRRRRRVRMEEQRLRSSGAFDSSYRFVGSAAMAHPSSTASHFCPQVLAQDAPPAPRRRALRARRPSRSCSRAALAHLSSSKLERKRRFWMRDVERRVRLRQRARCAPRG